ncbi:phosphatase PAP2 family protein [Bacteroides zoogleoformans]|mgnify:CR=1 FL=1|uniref:phosphatase PAP2 family protein n=1 Tax=Bacteroides zoogleoformans TaxID=28119 RepID=UPI00248E3E7E|nr:phosphatase PAP2 family protein [Bacteroides zoogleoformans]
MDIFQQTVETDTNVFFFFNRMHNEFFDYFMSTYSGKWVWVPMYAAIWYVMLRNFHWKVILCCVVGLALTIVLADQVCATLIRPCVDRLRPSNPDNPISQMVHVVNNHRGGRCGFPSCHAANTFGLAFFIFFLYRRRWLTLFIMLWALLTCYSRVYLGVHYPGDLLAGTLVGLAGAYVMYRLFVKVSGYRHAQQITHVHAPILIGGATIVGIFVYALMKTVRTDDLLLS